MSLIKLDRESYEYNLNCIANQAGGFKKLICVFKDNAYGHGAKILAPLAKDCGVEFIAVRTEEEARELEGFFKNILILSHHPNGEEKPRFIYALNELESIDKFKKHTRIHIKIDTNMHRNGICLEELKPALEKAEKRSLKLEGAFTHFAGADEMDASFFIQKENFQKAKEALRSLGGLIFHSHNSSALFRSNNFPGDELCRVGLAQFGYANANLKKVLSLYAHRLSSRILKASQSIGYGGAYTAKRDLRVATYDLGYADGLLRFNGEGELRLANGKALLGKMSMDSFSCEDLGEELCVFDDAEAWAKFFNTIVYEILVKLNPKIPRVLV